MRKKAPSAQSKIKKHRCDARRKSYHACLSAESNRFPQKHLGPLRGEERSDRDTHPSSRGIINNIHHSLLLVFDKSFVIWL